MSIGINQRLLALSFLPRRWRRAVMERRYVREIETNGEAELPYLRHLLARGDLAVDVGCNLGVYTYEMSRVCGRVIAFEPNPRLARLVDGLGLKGVEVRQAAASDSAQQAELFVPKGRFGFAMASLRPSASVNNHGERISVSTQRLDDIEGNVRFVKIDVEGFEEQTLLGADTLLATKQPICLIEIEERHNPGGFVRIVNRMQEYGYLGFFLQNGDWRLIERFDLSMQEAGKDDLSGIRPRRALEYINNFLFVPYNRVEQFSFLPQA